MSTALRVLIALALLPIVVSAGLFIAAHLLGVPNRRAGDVQAIQDAPPARGTAPVARRPGRVYLSRAATNRRLAQLDRECRDLPTWDQLAALYSIPEDTR
jgi:hypothetical protein